MQLKSTLIAAALAAALSVPIAATAQQVTLMTGPQGGVWVPLGGALKGMWEKAIPGLRCTSPAPASPTGRHRRGQGPRRLYNTITTVDGLMVARPTEKGNQGVPVANPYPQYYQVVVPVDEDQQHRRPQARRWSRSKGLTAEIVNALAANPA